MKINEKQQLYWLSSFAVPTRFDTQTISKFSFQITRRIAEQGSDEENGFSLFNITNAVQGFYGSSQRASRGAINYLELCQFSTCWILHFEVVWV